MLRRDRWVSRCNRATRAAIGLYFQGSRRRGARGFPRHLRAQARHGRVADADGGRRDGPRRSGIASDGQQRPLIPFQRIQTRMHPPPLHVMDYVGPVIGAALFVLVMSFVREPARRTFNAILVAGASGVYLNGGFGVWKLLYPLIALPVAYRGLQSYRIHRPRVADARELGSAASPVGQPNLAFHAHLVVRLHHLRRADRGLVLRQRAFGDRAPIPGVIEGALTRPRP